MTSFPDFGLSRITSAGFWLYVLITILLIAGRNLQHDLHHQLQVLCVADPLRNRLGAQCRLPPKTRNATAVSRDGQHVIGSLRHSYVKSLPAV